jgi:hypothetical protein
MFSILLKDLALLQRFDQIDLLGFIQTICANNQRTKVIGVPFRMESD